MRAESVAPPGLEVFFVHLFLGLTPQANHLSPLRGSYRSEAEDSVSEAPKARQMHSPGREPRGARR